MHRTLLSIYANLFAIVSWNWGSGTPGGKVAEKKTEGEIAITSKRGNKIKKNAEPNNPAVHIERSGNDVVKKASELNIEEKANGSSSGDKKDDDQSKSGDKRKHEETKENEETEDKPEALEENADGKTVKAKDSNKKQKKEPAKKEEKKEPAKKEEKKEPASKEEPKEPATKKKAGRPKKGEGAPSKKKEPTPRSTEGIGSRTRSRA